MKLKGIPKLAVEILIVFFVVCLFGAFFEGSIDVSTWDMATKSIVFQVTLLIGFFRIMN